MAAGMLPETQQAIFLLYNDGHVLFVDPENGAIKGSQSILLKADETITVATHFLKNHESFSVGTSAGRILQIQFESINDVPLVQSIYHSAELNSGPDPEKSEITQLLYQAANEELYFIWVQYNRLFIKSSFFSDDQEALRDVTPLSAGQMISAVALTAEGQNMVVGTNSGELYWFKRGKLEDNWKGTDHKVSELAFLAGDQTLIVADDRGQISSWFRIRGSRNSYRFKQIHTLARHKAAVTEIKTFKSDRNFLSLDRSGEVKIHHSTTGKSHRLFDSKHFEKLASVFILRKDRLLCTEINGKFSLYRLSIPFPEVTLPSLFGKIWYESYSKPEFVWQTGGGTAEYESKYSFVPLFFGTLKGALYAMLFSIPLGLLAAIYISQFASPRLGSLIKPAIEVLAGLPGVVIGVIAAIFLASFFSGNLLEVIIFVGLLPVLVLIHIFIVPKMANKLPIQFFKSKELIWVSVMLLVSLVIAKLISPFLEDSLFSGDLKQWLYNSFKVRYDQQNSMLVGIALGLAVIPTIFTISEDSLSRVPKSVISGALALGASYSQAVFKLIVPAATSGILASIMLAFGKAVGETMIILMISGNTPLINLSPFNGFRSVSATIAIEMPEALPGGSLYHLIFLMGLLLFVFTFILNFVASGFSKKLHLKYSQAD
jgi:phosphate transport system permease protein